MMGCYFAICFIRNFSLMSLIVSKFCLRFCRTPTFAEELLQAETGEGEGVKPVEKSFWAKYVRSFCSVLALNFYLYGYLLIYVLQ